MVLFTGSHHKDLFLVNLIGDKLCFMLGVRGEYIEEVKRYKAFCNEKSLPFFLVLHKEGSLYYYYFQDNKWKKSFLCSCQETTDFHLTVDNFGDSYILIENEEKNSFLYYSQKNSNWTKTMIAKNKNFRLLKWFIRDNKASILGTNENKSLTFWQFSTSNPEKWSLVYEYPLAANELLNIWFIPSSGTEFLSLDNNMNLKLVYTSLTEKGEILCKQTVAQLDQPQINKPILLKDTGNKGIVYTAGNRLYLYKYRPKEKKWVELKSESLFPLAIEEITTTTATAYSHLALTKILNIELEIPIIVSLDQLVQALEFKKAQSLGFHGIRKLGNKF